MKTAAALVLAALIAVPAAAGTPAGRESFTAFAVDLNGRYGAATTTLHIDIDRWSTPEELRDLESIFEENGPEALLAAVRKSSKAGRIRTGHTLGHDLRFALQVPLAGGGRRIVIATDRRTGFREVANRWRTLDYPFTVIELRVDENGKGQGQVTTAAKVLEFGETIDVESYTNTPVRLMQVRLEK